MSLDLCGRINARGHAAGWLAAQLQAQARAAGKTMAELYTQEGMVATNVPARAVRVVSRASQYNATIVEFRFLDGSTGEYPVRMHDE